MADYQNGKVYQIVGNGKTYVGSTVQELQTRLGIHKAHFKRWEKGLYHNCASYECLTDPECRIELLEACPCASKRELELCERQWIKTLDCINKRLPGQTRAEKLQQMKVWKASNREHVLQQNKEYYQRIKLERKKALLECNQPVETQP